MRKIILNDNISFYEAGPNAVIIVRDGIASEPVTKDVAFDYIMEMSQTVALEGKD